MSLDAATAARISAEFARAGLVGDRTGTDAALLALASNYEGTEADEATIRLLLLTQARQIGVLATKLAHALDIDLDAVVVLIGEIELPKSP